MKMVKIKKRHRVPLTGKMKSWRWGHWRASLPLWGQINVRFFKDMLALSSKSKTSRSCWIRDPLMHQNKLTYISLFNIFSESTFAMFAEVMTRFCTLDFTVAAEMSTLMEVWYTPNIKHKQYEIKGNKNKTRKTLWTHYELADVL